MEVKIDVEMSLDEWKALQEVSRPRVEFNIRKAEDKIPTKAKVIHQSRQHEVRKSEVRSGEVISASPAGARLTLHNSVQRDQLLCCAVLD